MNHSMESALLSAAKDASTRSDGLKFYLLVTVGVLSLKYSRLKSM